MNDKLPPIDYKRIEYTIRTFGSNFKIAPEIRANSFSFKEYMDWGLEECVLSILYKVYGRDCEEIKYPLNWKESVKERFAPVWFIKRYPVKYKIFTLTAMIPQHEIRGHKETFTFIENLMSFLVGG